MKKFKYTAARAMYTSSSDLNIVVVESIVRPRRLEQRSMAPYMRLARRACASHYRPLVSVCTYAR